MKVFIFLMFLLTFIYFLTHNKHYNNDKLFLLLSFILLFGIAAMRDESTGVDLPNYKTYYTSYSNLPIIEQIKMNYFEPGYLIYSHIIYLISNGSFRVLMIITSFISYLGVFIFIKNFSNNKLLSVILYICIGYYIAPFSGLRQCIALSMVFISYKFIINRDFKKFIILLLLAFAFHKSALVFLPAYFLYNYHIFENYEFCLYGGH